MVSSIVLKPSLETSCLYFVVRKRTEQARRHPERVFTILHHLIDVEFLHEAFLRLRKNAALGATKWQQQNTEGLMDRMTVWRAAG